MDALKDPSLSSSREPNYAESYSNNIYSDESSSNKFAALMDEIQTKSGDFIKAIWTTKSVTSRVGKIQVKPLSNDVYENIDSFMGSIDNVIKWYESENQRLRDNINSLWHEVAVCADGTDQQNEKMQHTIAEQQDAIHKLNQKIAEYEAQSTAQIDVHGTEEYKKLVSDTEKRVAALTFDHNERIKALEDEIAELKKENVVWRLNATMNRDSGRHIELKDVVIGAKINYDSLYGKILILDKVHYFNDKYCIAYYNNDGKESSIKILLNDTYKIRLTGTLGPMISNWGEQVEEYFKHFHSFNLKILNISKCRVAFNQFSTLIKSGTIERLILNGIFIKGRNNDAAIEKILELVPNLKEFDCTFTYDTSNVRGETASNLLSLPTFRNLHKFSLCNCSPEFDLETFGQFMKKHPSTKFYISISISNASKEIVDRLHAAKEAILSSWPQTSQDPSIFLRSSS